MPAFAGAPHVIGMDNDKDLRLFGAKANQRIEASCDKLTLFADGEIDVVFSSHLLEHIDDYRASLRDWWRVIRPGGRLILYIPHADHYPNVGMPGANPDHRHDFRNADIVEAMREVAESCGQGWDLERDEVRTEAFEYSFLQIYRKRSDAQTVVVEPKPKPEKTLGLVRLGAYGDALWITPILEAYKREGWHVTLFTQKEGQASLGNDPNIDEMRVQPDGIFGMGGPDTSRLQSAYWQWAESKFDRFVNLVGSVERTLLPHPIDPNFWLPDETRRRVMRKNYVENVYHWAGVDFDREKVRIKFTPTKEEIEFAKAERAKRDGPVVVINPTGSSLPKFWPHTQRAIEILEARGIHTVVLGDLRMSKLRPTPRSTIVGTQWTIRQCFTFAALADVVIGTESAIVNSVAHEPPLKIVLLSHSTAEQLTRDWSPCIAVEPSNLPCYPCHRIHADWSHCHRGKTGAAACQEAADPETVCNWAVQWIEGKLKAAA